MQARKAAALAGGLFFTTHVTSVGARLLYMPYLENPSMVSGGEPLLTLGIMLELVLAGAVVGTAVCLYPLLRQRGQGLALAYVGLRTLEAAVIAFGAAAMLSLPLLHRASAGGAAAISPEVDALIIQLVEAAFIVGPGIICPMNTVVITLLLFRERLVARWIPMLGLVGAPLVFVWNIGMILGISDASWPPAVLFVAPIFLWEITFAIYLIAKGLRTEASGAAKLPTELSAELPAGELRANSAPARLESRLS